MKLIGYIYLSLILIAVIVSKLPKQELISPLASVVDPPPVSAKETITVSCDTPKGYLECKAYQGEITWEQYDRLGKIIQCESKWNPDAFHANQNGSVDLGLLQINTIHKDISNADKLDYKKAIDWAIKKFKRDGNFNAWVCNRLVK